MTLLLLLLLVSSRCYCLLLAAATACCCHCLLLAAATAYCLLLPLLTAYCCYCLRCCCCDGCYYQCWHNFNHVTPRLGSTNHFFTNLISFAHIFVTQTFHQSASWFSGFKSVLTQFSGKPLKNGDWARLLLLLIGRDHYYHCLERDSGG